MTKNDELGTTFVKAFFFFSSLKTTALILEKSIMNPEGTKEKWILYVPT